MFEKKKTIKVDDVSFDMILVEGERVTINGNTVELDDYYICDTPVTQELWSKFLYNPSWKRHVFTQEESITKHIMTEIPPIPPVYFKSYDPIEDIQRKTQYEQKMKEYQMEVKFREEEKQRKEKDKQKRIEEETRQIAEDARKTPVNNVEWERCIEFIKKLNERTGLCFALPSFEQWYFAAIGGIESKGYIYPGSNDINEIGWVGRLKKNALGKVILDTTYNFSKYDTTDSNRYAEFIHKIREKKPNELGLYDMIGNVNEWLDTAGTYIGGSYFAGLSSLDRTHNFGLGYYEEGVPNCEIVGLRLVLLKKGKTYKLNYPQRRILATTLEEKSFIDSVVSDERLGMIRSFLSKNVAWGKWWRNVRENVCFRNPVYDIFLCPQNLEVFQGLCFSEYSRRGFVREAKQIITNFIQCLKEKGYNLMIVDNLGLSFEEIGLSCLPTISTESSRQKEFVDIINTNKMYVSSGNVVTACKIVSATGKSTNMISFAKNLIMLEINEAKGLNKQYKDNILYHRVLRQFAHPIIVAHINIFEDFYNCEEQVVSIHRKIKEVCSRMCLNDFEYTDHYKHFEHKDKGGQFVLNLPYDGNDEIYNDKTFFVLPEKVYKEWKHS